MGSVAKEIVCRLSSLLEITAKVQANDVILMLLHGELHKNDDFSCADKVRAFFEKHLSAPAYLIVDFSKLVSADLEAGRSFFASVASLPNLSGIYLIGTNKTFRLSVKLTTANDPFLPVFWTDSVDHAVAAIRTNYESFGRSFVPQPVFGLPPSNQRFYELWETHREVHVINKRKYRVLKQSHWYYEEADVFYASVEVVEAKVQSVRIFGNLDYDKVVQLRRVQERVFAELQQERDNYFYVFNLEKAELSFLDFLKLIFRDNEPIFLGGVYGLVGLSKRYRASVLFGNWMGILNQLPVFFFDTEEEAYNYMETEKIFELGNVHQRGVSKKLLQKVKVQEIENEILQNNIEVSREKLFHIVAQLHWSKADITSIVKSDSALYNDPIQALLLMKKEFSKAWGQYQDKLWQLQNNKEKSLRTQLDPHFIFNALNSIRQVILEKKATEAATFLNDFSDMVRLLIQNSFKTTVALEDEIQYLKLYVRMELLRFDESFEVEFEVEEPVRNTMGELVIPPVLMQPYLEQAIWERILPAQKFSKLSIRFALENDILKCIIKDNGLSFKQAQDRLNDFIREREERLNALRTRLALIEDMYDCQVKVFQNETTHIAEKTVLSEIAIHIPQSCF